MKNLFAPIIVLLSLCLYPVILNAQDALWLEVGSEWTFQHGVWSGPEHYQVTYGITEETTFAGRECVKMENTSSLALGCMGLQPPFYFYISNDSLYYANDELDDFRLAVDFGAEPGDSWEFVTGYGESTTAFTVTVNSVSVVEVDEFSLRRLNVTYEFDLEGGEVMYDYIFPETMEITEVIGAQYMFFIPMGHGAVCDYETEVTFQCFESPSFDYLNPDYPSCDFILSVDKPEDSIAISVFPNPASDVVNIEVPSSWTGSETSIHLINSRGQLVQSRAEWRTGTPQIHVEDLPKGLYYLSVENGENRVVRKLVVD